MWYCYEILAVVNASSSLIKDNHCEVALGSGWAPVKIAERREYGYVEEKNGGRVYVGAYRPDGATFQWCVSKFMSRVILRAREYFPSFLYIRHKKVIAKFNLRRPVSIRSCPCSPSPVDANSPKGLDTLGGGLGNVA